MKCCKEIHRVVIPRTWPPRSMLVREECNLFFGGAEMEAYGDQAAAASNQFCLSLGAEPSRKYQNHQHRGLLARSEREITGRAS